ncbi:amino acid ABC transporter substrate-binding protein [Ruegeria marina]|uniref:Amino acid ABC transporter substrate-binding protein, PAAT family n=1 Tax=Ruegeria marina TaxID=639004 RepID=A0A1G6QIA7_9RHOB|nr:amino acid ABC transporter substrate-binding protein [Ruegeria marina]SDC91654.1 amino acid ABC transporter substrate-binding protein, PAAT family [Ruegeria marina]
MRLLALTFAAMLAASASAAQTIERIRDSGQLTIGFRTDAPPLSFADAEGRPSGYTPMLCDRLAQAIADRLDLPELNASFVPVSTTDRFERIARGEIDILCGAATVTLERQKIVDFSIPVYVDGTSVISRRGVGARLSDLAGQTIGFRTDTTTEQAVRNSFQAAGLEARFEPFADHKAGFKALNDGALDAYFADQSILIFNYVSGRMAERFQILDEILTLEKQALALPRGDSDFRLLIDTLLSEMYADGTVGRVFHEALPGVEPGAALKAMFLIAPTLP